jgi:hypothetical protein
MTDDRTMADFRTQVAMLRRQRWRQVEYSEDPPVALLFAEADAQNRGGRGFSARSSARQDTWRKVWVNDAGRVMQENVDPPADEPEAAPAEAAKPAAAAKSTPQRKARPTESPAEPTQEAARKPAARARKASVKTEEADATPEKKTRKPPAKAVQNDTPPPARASKAPAKAAKAKKEA